jgi:hypothetical protein
MLDNPEKTGGSKHCLFIGLVETVMSTPMVQC